MYQIVKELPVLNEVKCFKEGSILAFNAYRIFGLYAVLHLPPMYMCDFTRMTKPRYHIYTKFSSN